MDKWIQPATKETAYALGARVLHNGAVWESTLKENMSEPGTAGATWTLIEPALRQKALDAYNAEENAWKAEALAALTAVIGADSSDVMEIVHTDITTAYHLAIWSDGDLSLSTRKRSGGTWEVRLVADEDGWTEKSEALADLSDLGEALAEAG